MLIELFAEAPQRDDLIVCSDRRVSSTEIVEQALGFAAAFNARGIGHGDPVAFQMPTGIDAIALYRACWRIGAVAVPVHPRAGAAQIADMIDQSHPSLLVSHPGFALADEPGALDIEDLSGGEAPEVDCRRLRRRSGDVYFWVDRQAQGGGPYLRQPCRQDPPNR